MSSVTLTSLTVCPIGAPRSCLVVGSRLTEKSWQWKTERQRGRRNAQEDELLDFGTADPPVHEHTFLAALVQLPKLTHTETFLLFLWLHGTFFLLLNTKNKKSTLLEVTLLGCHGHPHRYSTKTSGYCLTDWLLVCQSASACLHPALPLSVGHLKCIFHCTVCVSLC